VIPIDEQKLFCLLPKEAKFEISDNQKLSVYVMNESSCYHCLKPENLFNEDRDSTYILMQTEGFNSVKRRDLSMKFKKYGISANRVILYKKDESEKHLQEYLTGTLSRNEKELILTINE